MRKWLLRGLIFLSFAFILYAASAFNVGRPSCRDSGGCVTGFEVLVPIFVASLVAWLGCWTLALLAVVRRRWPKLFKFKQPPAA